MEPSGWVLRITVESLRGGADGGPVGVETTADSIALGLLAEISRDISAALDVADIIPHRYHLEVSSPGLERPLRFPRDYARAVGQVAKLRLVAPAPDGQHVLRGRIIETDGTSVSMDVDGKIVSTAFANVERAHLIFELPAQPKRSLAKPGKPKRN